MMLRLKFDNNKKCLRNIGVNILVLKNIYFNKIPSFKMWDLLIYLLMEIILVCYRRNLE